MRRLTSLLAFLALAATPAALQAQYFGQNKVQYTKFDFRVLETEHFDVSRNSGNHRQLVVEPNAGWEVGFYRIVRSDGGLLCEDVEGSPDVSDFGYYIEVMDCESLLLGGGFDMNSDDAVTEEGDLPAWFLSPVDFNGDNEADGDDYLILESACELFAECD